MTPKIPAGVSRRIGAHGARASGIAGVVGSPDGRCKFGAKLASFDARLRHPRPSSYRMPSQTAVSCRRKRMIRPRRCTPYTPMRAPAHVHVPSGISGTYQGSLRPRTDVVRIGACRLRTRPLRTTPAPETLEGRLVYGPSLRKE